MVEQPSFHFSTIRAIIGLGNPGSRYALTRHSIGFLFVDALVNSFGVSWHAQKEMEVAELIIESGQKLWVIKPQTFMNDSGRVIPFLTKKGIKPEEILVVHDELEKKFGHIQIRFGGSHRGHNGLKSISEQIGFEFWRVRLGIDRPTSHEQGDVGSYVLSSFSLEEQAILSAFIEKAVIFVKSNP